MILHIVSSSNLPTLPEIGPQKERGLCKPHLKLGISGCSQLGQGHLKSSKLVFLIVGRYDLSAVVFHYKILQQTSAIHINGL